MYLQENAASRASYGCEGHTHASFVAHSQNVPRLSIFKKVPVLFEGCQRLLALGSVYQPDEFIRDSSGTERVWAPCVQPKPGGTSRGPPEPPGPRAKNLQTHTLCKALRGDE